MAKVYIFQLMERGFLNQDILVNHCKRGNSQLTLGFLQLVILRISGRTIIQELLGYME